MTARQYWERLRPDRRRRLRLMVLVVLLPLVPLVVATVDWSMSVVLLIAWLVREEEGGVLC